MNECESTTTALYKIFLGRDPDDLGLHHYAHRIEQGESPFSIAATLCDSQEFAGRLADCLLKIKNVADIYVQNGEQALARNDFEEAKANFELALALNPRLAPAYQRRGLVALKMNRSDEALSCFNLALTLAPDVAETHRLRALAFLGAGRPEEALGSAERALALDPSQTQGLIARALAFKAQGRVAEALACLESAEAADPGSFDAPYQRGLLLEETGRPREARAVYRLAQAADPHSPEIHFRLGLAAEADGDEAAAWSHFGKAASLAPDHFESWFRSGALLAKKLGLPGAVTDQRIGLDLPAPSRPVTYLLYSETADNNVTAQLGRPEYSYFFVREAFRKMLEPRADVVVIGDPREADGIHDRLRAQGESCVLLSFAPPHRSLISLRCPAIPIFAWEFDTIPTEDCGIGRLDDWRRALAHFGCAIVHSRFASAAVAKEMYPGFPALSIPAPIWDRARRPPEPKPAVKPEKPAPFWRRFASASKAAVEEDASVRARMALDCELIDGKRRAQIEIAAPGAPRFALRFAEDEIVYVAVFNPDDGRKNWKTLVRAFCIACRDNANATLVLKLVHHKCAPALEDIAKVLAKAPPFRCRVVAIGDFLEAEDYALLVAKSHYALNMSFGEGQCLPLMEFMSRGKPAVSPAHTSMADYIDETCAFVVAAHREPCAWPHDNDDKLRAHRYGIDWDSALRALEASYRVASETPEIYRAMGERATENQRRFCSEDVIFARLREMIAFRFWWDDARERADAAVAAESA